MVDLFITEVTGAANDVIKVLFAVIGILILIAIIKWIQQLKGRGTEIRVYRSPE